MSEEKKQEAQPETAKTDENAIYCNKCGSKNKTDANYCSKCGAKIVVSQDNLEDSAQKFGESVGKVAKKGWATISAAGKGFMNGIKTEEETKEKPKEEEN